MAAEGKAIISYSCNLFLLFRQHRWKTSHGISTKIDLLSVTFDSETADICSVILTHPIGGHYVATIIVSTSLVW